ncbi:hypothetical protein [Nioella sp.]|uniref:hypothetical protein n=1 Tax=Nioella sp. TaxID=1912091 RepID=UPI0035151589
MIDVEEGLANCGGGVGRQLSLVDERNAFDISSLRTFREAIVNKLLLSTSFAALLGTSAAYADPTFMLGGTISFGAGQGSQFGISARILSNNQEDEATFGAGITYYPGSGDFGYDVFAGWNFDNSVLGIGYDFGQRTPIMSLGVSNTEGPTPQAVPMPPSPMPPSPMPPSPMPPSPPPLSPD